MDFIINLQIYLNFSDDLYLFHHTLQGRSKIGIVMCSSWEYQTNNCSIYWFENSFLIDFFATWPNMPLCFSAMSSIKVDDIMVPFYGPCTNHHFS